MHRPFNDRKRAKPRWGDLGFFIVLILLLQSVYASSAFAEAADPRVDVVVLLRSSTISEMLSTKEAIEEMGFHVNHIFPNNAFFVKMPPSLKEKVESLPAVQIVSFEKLTPSDYPNHTLAIKVWNENYFPGGRRDAETVVETEPFRDTVEIAPDLPKTKEEREEANRGYLEGFRQRKEALERKYNR